MVASCQVRGQPAWLIMLHTVQAAAASLYKFDVAGPPPPPEECHMVLSVPADLHLNPSFCDTMHTR